MDFISVINTSGLYEPAVELNELTLPPITTEKRGIDTPIPKLPNIAMTIINLSKHVLENEYCNWKKDAAFFEFDTSFTSFLSSDVFPLVAFSF